MDKDKLKQILDDVAEGKIRPDDAMESLKHLPFTDLGFARVDHHRHLRAGAAEVIYCPGKTLENTVSIAESIRGAGCDVIATRATREVFDAFKAKWQESVYFDKARIAAILKPERPAPVGKILVLCAGTADIPVAEEARVTAELLGNAVDTSYDVGVAGIHRLLASTKEIQAANVIIVVAGMEGALASVVGGIAASPVIAVPTSVGYGASFSGIAPLLTMLNSCAPTVSVVNIDNGFGAGYIASRINKMAAR